MKIRVLWVRCRIVCQLALAVLVGPLAPHAAWAGTMSVTATKDNNSPANVTEAFFSILIAQKIFWTATYSGTPQQGNDFYVSHPGNLLNEFPLTTTGAGSGNFLLQPGNYQISIKFFGMGPGIYTVKFDPTGNGANNGDPHLTTVDGVHYDFQSAGEFVALRDGSGMEIQTRQTPISTATPVANPYTGLTTGVSLNTAVAARVGTHRVTYQLGNDQDINGLQLRIDGVLTTLQAKGQYLGSGGAVTPSIGGGIRTDFPDGTVLIVTPIFWESQHKTYLNLDVFHTPAREGIMGVISPQGWLPALPNGESVGPKPASLHQRFVSLYEKFADAWRVTDGTSLFDYAQGQSTATYTILDWPRETPPFVIPGVPIVKPARLALAQRVCKGIAIKSLREDCVFDVRVTGFTGFAKNYRLIQQIRFGATATTVSSERYSDQAEGPVTFDVLVASLSSINKGTPVGTVQFTLDGAVTGTPIKVDAHGRAVWKTSRLNLGDHKVGVQYVPDKGSIFLPSSILEVPR